MSVIDYGDTIFLAALSSTTSSSAGPVIFDWVQINHGGHYNNDTGIYTVPYDGIYQFHVQTPAYSSSGNVRIDIEVDGTAVGSHADPWVHDQYRSATVLLEIEAGQEVNVLRSGGAYGDTTYLRSYFSGYMISTN